MTNSSEVCKTPSRRLSSLNLLNEAMQFLAKQRTHYQLNQIARTAGKCSEAGLHPGDPVYTKLLREGEELQKAYANLCTCDPAQLTEFLPVLTRLHQLAFPPMKTGNLYGAVLVVIGSLVLSVLMGLCAGLVHLAFALISGGR